MIRPQSPIEMKTSKKGNGKTRRASPPVPTLNVIEAIQLMRTGIPVAELPRYRRTIMGVNESFWEHIEFLEGLGAARVKDGPKGPVLAIR
jgi:hypothetical protein